jgi:nucleoid DNA-binding protein
VHTREVSKEYLTECLRKKEGVEERKLGGTRLAEEKNKKKRKRYTGKPAKVTARVMVRDKSKASIKLRDQAKAKAMSRCLRRRRERRVCYMA